MCTSQKTERGVSAAIYSCNKAAEFQTRIPHIIYTMRIPLRLKRSKWTADYSFTTVAKFKSSQFKKYPIFWLFHFCESRTNSPLLVVTKWLYLCRAILIKTQSKSSSINFILCFHSDLQTKIFFYKAMPDNPIIIFHHIFCITAYLIQLVSSWLNILKRKISYIT